MREKLTDIYDRLIKQFGPQSWWPAESPFEVILGAVLTQNTNWQNVERAIANLKGANLMAFERLAEIPSGLLAGYIRPAGYYNIKAGRLQNLFGLINDEYGGSVEDMLADETERLRRNLLAVKGVGPETADSILLYAANRPVFVVDAYTHRILSRHDLILDEADYGDIQELFMANIEPDARLYNEYHALLVCVGKEYCRKTTPRCDSCPLQGV